MPKFTFFKITCGLYNAEKEKCFILLFLPQNLLLFKHGVLSQSLYSSHSSPMHLDCRYREGKSKCTGDWCA